MVKEESEVKTGVSISRFVKPESPPPFFAIDVDSTFRAENEEAWKRNVEAFINARKKGYTPFLCTGRSHRFALKVIGGSEFIRATGYNGYPGIYNNGSLVYDEHGIAVYSNPSFRDCLSNYIDFWTLDAFINKQRSRLLNAFRSIMDMNRRLVRSLLPRNVASFATKMPNWLIHLCSIVPILNTSKFKDVEDKPWDFRPPGVNKAIAIMKLMEHYKVPANACAFIGDGDNDVEAMDFCDLSFAVGNASEEVKRHAKWVMDLDYNQGAVAEALKLVYGP